MNKTFAATECAEHKVMYRIRHRGYGFYEPTLARCEEFRAAYIKELNAKSADATDITSCEERN